MVHHAAPGLVHEAVERSSAHARLTPGHAERCHDGDRPGWNECSTWRTQLLPRHAADPATVAFSLRAAICREHSQSARFLAVSRTTRSASFCAAACNHPPAIARGCARDG